MKKVFKKLYKEVAENQINNRFDNPEEVNHFIFLTKKPNEEAKYLSVYHDEELEKMLYKMASENKGFFDVMKKVVAEIEKPKISFDFGFHGESVTVGLVAAIKSFQDLNKQKEASRRANYPSGGIIQGKGHEEFVLPIWRTPSEIHEQALKDNLKTERFSILPKGTIYHDIAASNNFNDKKKVYFYFIDRKRRTIKTIVDANEYRGIRDSLLQKIYWKWA